MALNLMGGEGGKSTVSIHDRVDIDPNQPVPAYDLAPAVAYAAAHRRDPGREIIALVCDPNRPKPNAGAPAGRQAKRRPRPSKSELELDEEFDDGES